jgi:catechol 2,3-dioxygenase-like lactoylglutathione lyase family enzyme
MLGDYEMIAFTQTTKPEKANAFYGDVLGLELLEDSPVALVFLAGRTTLRIQKVHSFTPLPFTSLGWKVRDIGATVHQLSTRGVTCERFEGINQDELGVWSAPGGAKVCWFKDPDGNILSLTELP